METVEEKRGGVKVVGLCGRLDATTCPDVEKRLLTLVDEGEVRIAIDFSGLSYISSAGLRLLMLVAKRVQASGGRLALAALNDNVHEIFKISGLTQLFYMYQTVDEAATYCAG